MLLSGLRIAWLDDEINLYGGTISALVFEGASVSPASSISQFLSALAGKEYDILLLDIKISEIEDGIALAKHLKALGSYKVALYSNFIERDEIPNLETGLYFIKKKPEHLSLKHIHQNELAEQIQLIIDHEEPTHLRPVAEYEIPFKWSSVAALQRFAIQRLTMYGILAFLALRFVSIFNIRLGSLFTEQIFLNYAIPAVLFLIFSMIYYFRCPPEIRNHDSETEYVNFLYITYRGDKSVRDHIMSETGQKAADSYDALSTHFQFLNERNPKIVLLLWVLFCVACACWAYASFYDMFLGLRL